jgi:hypothetical protein
MGLLGAALVTRWSWGLLRDTGRLLLDRQAPEPVLRAVREAIEGAADNRLYDLHVWSVAPGAYAAALAPPGAVPDPPLCADRCSCRRTCGSGRSPSRAAGTARLPACGHRSAVRWSDRRRQRHSSGSFRRAAWGLAPGQPSLAS